MGKALANGTAGHTTREPPVCPSHALYELQSSQRLKAINYAAYAAANECRALNVNRPLDNRCSTQLPAKHKRHDDAGRKWAGRPEDPGGQVGQRGRAVTKRERERVTN